MKKNYLFALEEAYRLDSGRSLSTVSELTVSQLQLALETQDSAELMQATVACLTAVLQRYPTAFQRHFRDTVDILVGWHIDPTQPAWVGQLASRSLCDLKQFWAADADFGSLLTGQFVEDMDSYAMELAELQERTAGRAGAAPDPGDDRQQLTEEACSKIVELIKVYSSVMVARAEAGDSEKDSSTCAAHLRVIAECLLSVGRCQHSDLLVTTGCAALGHLVTLLGQRLGADVQYLLSFVTQVWPEVAHLSDLSLVAVCRLLETMLRHGGTVLPSDLMDQLFGRNSPLRPLRLSYSEQVRSAVLATYRAALGLKNVPLLQDVYRHVLADLHESFLAATGVNPALESTASTAAAPEDTSKTSPGTSDVIGPNDGRQLVAFCLQALAELASTRNSIIGLWALSPSIVDLLAVSLRPDDRRVAASQPLIKHMTLSLLYTHCDRHRHFLSTSRLTRSERTTPALVPSVAPSTGHNLTTLLALITRLLTQPEGLSDTERLLLLWAGQLAEAAAAGGYTEQLLRSGELAQLAAAAAERARSPSRQLARCAAETCRRLVVALGWDTLPAPLRQQLCEVCAVRLDGPRPLEVDGAPLLTCLPPDQLLSALHAQATDVTLGRQTVVRARRHLRTRQVAVPARPVTWRRFVDGLADSSSPLDWVPEAFRSCQDASVAHKADDAWMLPARGNLLKLWCDLSAAEFCVQNRLKTPPHKKPERTLTELDDKIRECVASNGSGLARLVAFLETFDKCIYLASEGSALMPAVFSKAVRSFFRANAATCREWLLRARRHLLRAPAALARLPAAGGVQLVRGLRRLEPAGAEDGWMEAAELLAAGRHGQAADALKEYVLERTAGETLSAQAVDQELLSALGDRVLDSYLAVGRYDEAIAWRETMTKHQLPCSDQVLDNLDNIRLLAKFADGDYSGAAALAVDSPPAAGGLTSVVGCQLETAAAAAALCAGGEHWKAAGERLTAATERVARVVHEGATEHPPAVAPAALLSLQTLHRLLKVRGGASANRIPLPELAEPGWRARSLDTPALLQLTHWSQCLQTLGAVQPTDPAAARIRLTAVKRLRRSGDAEPAARLLLCRSVGKGDGAATDLAARLRRLVTDPAESAALPEVRREAAKLLHGLGDPDSAAEALLGTPVGDITSRTDLLLARWLSTADGGTPVSPDPTLLERYLSAAPTGELGGVDSRVVPPQELPIGRLLEAGVHRCPEDAKAWFQLAAWCYTWGKQAVTESQSRSAEQLDAAGSREAVRALLPAAAPELVDRVTDIVERSHVSAESLDQEDDIEEDIVSSAAWARSQLSAVAPSPDCVEPLLALWRAAQRRVYGHLGLAAAGYLRFLRLQPSACERSTLAALRLLRLIVKHAAELRESLVEGLADTPAGPWKAIIPQLFSRLDHPEPAVRAAIGSLLCAVADDDPPLIVFPAVVGSDTARADATETADGEDRDGEEAEEDPETARRADSYSALVDTLRKRTPAAIDDVTVLVRELRRVTLLWDELWAGALAQHQAEATRRLAGLASELQKVAERDTLTEQERTAIATDKYSIAVRPILYMLEKLHTITSAPPETPHEKMFQKLYQSDIEAALAELRQPSELWAPRSAWEPFRRLAGSLQQRLSGRAAQTLSLPSISPVLAELRDTAVTMPGVTETSLTVTGIDHAVTILPTKTRPKKLHLRGSDGRSYPYLFKGLEDLHLDERIMQLLAITNQMLAKPTEEGQRYRARRYAVVPLGPRSGLIQWLEGSTPVFGLYKRWQQRAATANGTAGPVSASVPRPSDLFTARLQPLLRSAGLSADSSRRDWPTDVLVTVLEQLQEDTPPDILARELWLGASSAGAWWSATQAYTRSMAVMSMAGYLIGLGDRHLDNLLLDVSTGEVVHIDYNVCFEKGRSLRIPERVPYRMTQNLRTALGVTGLEGPFRLGCEHVLATLRAGSETLLTLLEAFVYDPLVDWTPAHDAGFTGAVYGGRRAAQDSSGRRRVERAMTVSLFCVQVAEMKPEWTENKRSLTAALEKLRDQFTQYLSLHGAFSSLEDSGRSLSEQQALLTEALSNQLSSVWSLPERWARHRSVSMAVSAAHSRLEEGIKQWTVWDTAYQTADSVLLSGQLLEWSDAVSGHGLSPCPPAVLEFLVSAGQQQLAQQCTEMDDLLRERSERLLRPLQSAVSALRQMAALLPYLPPSQLRGTHRVRCYLAWLTALRQQLNTERLDEVRGQFRSVFGSEPYTATRARLLTEVRAQYQHIQTANNYRIQELESGVGSADPAQLSLTLESGVGSADPAQLRTELERLFELAQAGPEEEAAARRCTLLSALYTAGRQLLRLETTAHGAGDRLVEMTSQEGRWFVDELAAAQCWLERLGRLVTAGWSKQEVPSAVKEALDDLAAAQDVMQALQDLKTKFTSIILPEGLRYSQQEEPSVLTTITSVSDIISAAGVPLHQLMGSLEQHVRHLVLGVPSQHEPAVATARALLAQFQAQVNRRDGQMTQGQMLLMGFNILFETVERKVETLVARLPQLREWASVDCIRDAAAIMAPLRSAATREVLQLMTFLLRLELLQNFFTKCLQNAAAYTGVEMPQLQLSVCSDGQLTAPLRQCISGYLRRTVLGLPSLLAARLTCRLADTCGISVTAEVAQREVGADSRVPLEELVRAALERALADGTATSGQLARCQQRVTQLETAWRQHSLLSACQEELAQCQRAAERYQLSEAAHLWLYHDLTGTAGTGRDLVLDQLNRAISAAHRCPPLWDLCDEFSQLAQSVEQRLRWAAGANAEVTQLLESHTSSVQRCQARVADLRQLLAAVAELGRSVLHSERLRGRGADPAAEDSRFIQLLGEVQEAARLSSDAGQSVTPSEAALCASVPPPDRMTAGWIAQAASALQELQQTNTEEVSERQSEMFVCWDEIRGQVGRVRDLLTAHHKLISDVRLLLKAIAKGSGDELPAVETYMTQHRGFSEPLTTLIRSVLNEPVSRDHVTEYLTGLEAILQSTGAVYDTLVALAGQLSSAPAEDTKPLTPREKPSTQRDPRTGRGIQGCNQYALAVWRRVRQKLEGRDPDPNRTATVEEQVDFTIREATSTTNLALLYEGWTPWV
ncbi:serine/threonine-protein kinase SMG1-like [Amphibalanus amphitrite]|uniref:serine/threonine-protein kinase SMG1-like n=1 Tax=Amphibalanus amphitrite TaxID=1232801 RepID=UPI001C91026D|nr:serine/threonine-protein kinase SMG1-like [Amphibalanus amphitrite]